MFTRRKTSQEGEHNSFWISYSDILSSLLIIILLVTIYVIYELMVTKRNVVESLDEVTKAELVRKDILETVKEQLQLEGITVEIADNFTVLRIPESTLSFQSNNYSIPSEMRFNLSKIGRVLLRELQAENRSEYFDTIFIEGHTDIRPTNREMGNWGLSTFRAISVWNHWVYNVSSDYSILSNANGTKLFSVSGYGESRPATEFQNNEDDYRKNRRIDVRFTIRKPSSTEYNDVLRLFDED